MTMVGQDRLQQLVEECWSLVAYHSFTIDYQNKQESREHVAKSWHPQHMKSMIKQ